MIFFTDMVQYLQRIQERNSNFCLGGAITLNDHDLNLHLHVRFASIIHKQNTVLLILPPLRLQKHALYQFETSAFVSKSICQ